MGGQPVTLDFSKAQPITPPAPPSVTLDFSKAQPIANQSGDTVAYTDGKPSNPVLPPSHGIDRADDLINAVAPFVRGAIKGGGQAVKQFWGATNLPAAAYPGMEKPQHPTDLTPHGAEETVGSIVGPMAVGGGEGSVADAAGDTAQGVKAGLKAVGAKFDKGSVQEPLQQSIRDLIGKVEEDAGLHEAGDSAAETPSIRDVFHGLGQKFIQRSQEAYKQLDAATGGRFQRFDDAIENVNQKLREITDPDGPEEKDLLTQKSNLMQAKQNAFEVAKAKVDPNIIDKANADYKQGQALYDTGNEMRRTSVTSGDATGANAKDAVKVNPTGLQKRLNVLHDRRYGPLTNPNRLEQALGPERAQQLHNAVSTAKLEEAAIAKRIKVAKAAAGLAGFGSVDEIVKHFMP